VKKMRLEPQGEKPGTHLLARVESWRLWNIDNRAAKDFASVFPISCRRTAYLYGAVKFVVFGQVRESRGLAFGS
jgi:hypothetical protein